MNNISLTLRTYCVFKFQYNYILLILSKLYITKHAFIILLLSPIIVLSIHCLEWSNYRLSFSFMHYAIRKRCNLISVFLNRWFCSQEDRRFWIAFSSLPYSREKFSSNIKLPTASCRQHGNVTKPAIYCLDKDFVRLKEKRLNGLSLKR